jgi:hypothetical protein
MDVDVAHRIGYQDGDAAVKELARANVGARRATNLVVVLIDEDGELCARRDSDQAGCGWGGSFARDASSASSGSVKSSIWPLR